MLKVVGTKFYDGNYPVVVGGKERLVGVNESMATTYKQGVEIGHYLPRYKNYNMNFPVYSGEATEIPAASDREFFWKYGWLMNYLGGDVETMMVTPDSPSKKVAVKGQTFINLGRFGPHNRYGGVIQVKCFREHRAYNDQMMKDLLDMMKANNMYVIFTLGWSPGEGDGSGDVCIVDSTAYWDFVAYEVDYICAYHGHPALGMWDLFNEPYIDSSVSSYWKPKYGEEIEANGLPKYENAFLKFKDRLLTDVKAGVRARISGDMPIITMGHTTPSVMWGIWSGHPQEAVDKEWARAQLHSANNDVFVQHSYWSAEDDYLRAWPNQTAKKLNKPHLMEEIAKNTTQSPWVLSFWSWAELTDAKYGMSDCWMVLNKMDAIPEQNREEEVAYPGYPIPQAIMDAIPPMPDDVPPEPPEPEPTPVTIKVSVKLPPVALPDVEVPGQLAPVPSTTISIPMRSVKGKVTMFGRNWDAVITLPAETIVVPATAALVPQATVTQGNLEIPPFEVEVSWTPQ